MKGFLFIVLSSTILKLLLIKSYVSTDFEVHRNWLAITHSLPLKQWYYENRSEWTLDYPPYFAWFEYGLSHLAKQFDQEMVKVENHNYRSNNTILFQRLSVIGADVLYLYSVFQIGTLKDLLIPKSQTNSFQAFMIVLFLFVFNFGLVIVDHIHFQYNGFLTGILILSITCIFKNQHIKAAILFAALLNFKHIYLYMAPAYFIYLLGHFCFEMSPDSSVWRFRPLRFLMLGLAVVIVFLGSFGPFIVFGQLNQVLSRLFPFKRGLCHAYWAPNFWALYNLADKGLSVGFTKMGLISKPVSAASMTGGLVQEFDHEILPSIRPIHTMVLTFLAMLPSLWKLWRCQCKGDSKFLESLVLCSFASFIFGWHVHEKAILLVIIPLTLLVFLSKAYTEAFLHITTIGHYSLFPLLFTPAEAPFKVIFYLFYTAVSFTGISLIYPDQRQTRFFQLPMLNTIESLHVWGLVPLYFYCHFGHFILGLNESLPFLPLLLTSVYCALGLFYAFVKLHFISWGGAPSEKQKVH